MQSRMPAECRVARGGQNGIRSFLRDQSCDGCAYDEFVGGVFSLFAREVIRAGGVVYGTVFDEHTHVRLARAETEAEILPMRGSKYAQSEIGMGYRRVREDLEAVREVLFSGVPCQCVALHAFLGKTYDRLTVIEVLCHGAPSPVVWENYVAYRMQQAGTDAYPTDIDMSKKEGIAGAGWGKECLSMAFPNGAAYVRTNRKDPFMVLSFRADAILNKSC